MHRGVWLLPVMGLLIMLLGVYAAGATTVTCSRSRLTPAISESADGTRPPLVAQCRVETRRWLARKVVDERTYLRVTKVDSIAVSRTETSRDSSGRTTSRVVDDWYLQLFDNETEVHRLSGARDDVDDSKNRMRAWFESGGAEPVEAGFSGWPFAWAAGAFGLVWTLVTSFAAKMISADGGAYQRSRRQRQKRWQRL